MIPKSIAPKLIKLALTLPAAIPVNVNNIAKGITNIVIIAARILPKKINKMATTNSAPSSRLVFTVLIALSIKIVRSYIVLVITPAGKV